MYIYKKILDLREKFAQENIKKNGHNTFSHFKYFRLEEILPPAKRICKELGLFTQVSFFRDEHGVGGKMVVFDTESKSQMEIFSGSGTANLKACHDIQNVGAVQTYIIRYLWSNLLQLVEGEEIEPVNDIDGISGMPEEEEPAPKPSTQKKPKNTQSSPKVEPPKPEAPADKPNPTANYRKHFDKQIALIPEKDLPLIKQITEKNIGDWDNLSISDMKNVISELKSTYKTLGLEV